MKRLLRSVIDFEDGRVSAENLLINFQRLRNSNIEWARPADGRIANYITEFFHANQELPSSRSVEDFFVRADDIEAQERIKDIEAAKAYVRTNFAHLLKTLCEDQNRIKMRGLVKETEEIISKGLVIEEGREKTRLQGTKDALLYFTRRANELIPPDYDTQTRGDLRDDTEGAWKEYQETKLNKAKAWGKFTGLNEIDKVCHGLKRGELWLHAAFAGDLKCLPGDTWVYDHLVGRRRTLRELHEAGDLPRLTALHREGGGLRWQLVETQASHLQSNGVREVFDLTLKSGRTIGATSNHRFFTPTGWRELGSLSPGDWVAVPKQTKPDVNLHDYTKAEMALLGYLIGDGSVSEYIRLTCTNDDILADAIECLEELGYGEGEANPDQPTYTVKSPEDRARYLTVTHATGEETNGNWAPSPVRLLLGLLGVWGATAETKLIPDELFGLREDLLAVFLGALWSTDGSCSTGDYERPDRTSLNHRNTISYSSKSHQLCLGIQSLLLRLGIKSSVRPVDTTYQGMPYRFWTVYVTTNPSKRAFCDLIRVVGKEERFAELRRRLRDGDNSLVPSELVPDGLKVRAGKGHRYSSQVKGRRPAITVETAKLFCRSWLPTHDLTKAVFGDLAWEQVESVVPRGREETFDLEVPEHHSFVANDIITHNTTFATTWAYNLVTRYRSNVLYVSLEMPYKQLRRIIYTMHSRNAKFQVQGQKPLDYRQVRDGELGEREPFYKEVLDDFDNNPDYCHLEVWAPDRDVTIADIRLEAELKHKEMDVDLIVVDHGGLVEPKRRHQNFTIEQNSIIRDAKKMALHFNGGQGVPVLLLFQTNRDGFDYAAKNEGKYKLRALSYANEAERSADAVSTTFLGEEGSTYRENETTMVCNLKNRDNPFFPPFLAKVDFRCRKLMNLDPDEADNPGIQVDEGDNVDPLTTMMNL